MSRPISQRLQRKRVGFKPGHECHTIGKSFDKKPNNEAQNYVRVDSDVFEARVVEHNDTLTFRDVDGSATSSSPLRPLSRPQSLVDKYASPENFECHPDLFLMKSYAPALVQVMFNTEIKQHCIENGCTGDLNFDPDSSRPWGSAWAECLKCTRCDYKSKSYKLYEEVNDDKSKRGRKAAKVRFVIINFFKIL